MEKQNKQTGQEQALMLTQKERDLSWIKKILSNTPLLRWVNQLGCEQLMQDSKHADAFKEYLHTTEDTLTIMDTTNTKMLLTDTEFNGRVLAGYSLEYIQSIIKAVGTEGRLIVVKEDYPCFIEVKHNNVHNIVVLAPRVESDSSSTQKSKIEQKRKQPPMQKKPQQEEEMDNGENDGDEEDED